MQRLIVDYKAPEEISLALHSLSRVVPYPVPGDTNLSVLHYGIVVRHTNPGLVQGDAEPPVLVGQSLAAADHLLRGHTLVLADLQEFQCRCALLYTLRFLPQATENQQRKLRRNSFTCENKCA